MRMSYSLLLLKMKMNNGFMWYVVLLLLL